MRWPLLFMPEDHDYDPNAQSNDWLAWAGIRETGRGFLVFAKTLEAVANLFGLRSGYSCDADGIIGTVFLARR